jgi:hypothetical protein
MGRGVSVQQEETRVQSCLDARWAVTRRENSLAEQQTRFLVFLIYESRCDWLLIPSGRVWRAAIYVGKNRPVRLFRSFRMLLCACVSVRLWPSRHPRN